MCCLHFHRPPEETFNIPHRFSNQHPFNAAVMARLEGFLKNPQGFLRVSQGFPKKMCCLHFYRPPEETFNIPHPFQSIILHTKLRPEGGLGSDCF